MLASDVKVQPNEDEEAGDELSLRGEPSACPVEMPSVMACAERRDDELLLHASLATTIQKEENKEREDRQDEQDRYSFESSRYVSHTCTSWKASSLRPKLALKWMAKWSEAKLNIFAAKSESQGIQEQKKKIEKQRGSQITNTTEHWVR